MAPPATQPPFRIGFGYDVHRFAEGRALWLGGVKLDYHLGLDGHSDADVLLHAICDAILGAAGLRDIGYHFPNTDARWKGIDSKLLLTESYRLAQAEGYTLGNVDCTLVAEAPKINPHITTMQGAIAGAMPGVEPSQIGIKATTNEGMGFVGREEGMAAYAVALLLRN
jgi:2-C-methyl-D-erythritol 2,4-cyclodiphosphate synthase